LPRKSLLTPVVSESSWHPHFKQLLDGPLRAPTRTALEDLFQDFVDVDGGKFVKDFQTAGFDARLFELFLDCVFRFEGYRRDVEYARPDFVLSGRGYEFCVEAVTLNPTGGKPLPPFDASELAPRADGENDLERLHLTPVLMHEALTKKLSKRYWDLPHVRGKPLIIALQNFSERFSLGHSSNPLIHLLYGIDFQMAPGTPSRSRVRHVELHTHERGGRAVPSRFFEDPENRYISAVLFTNTGTISKFTRFEYRRNRARYPQISAVIRYGERHVHGPEAFLPEPFIHRVGEDGTNESWCEGLTVLHNPSAAYPLDHLSLPGVSHVVRTPEGELLTYVPEFHPYWSHTSIHRGGSVEDVVQRLWKVLRDVRRPRE